MLAGWNGSKSRAAPPAVSGRLVVLEQATGTPRLIASITGSPKPSAMDGCNTPSAFPYAHARSSLLIRPGNSTSARRGKLASAGPMTACR